MTTTHDKNPSARSMMVCLVTSFLGFVALGHSVSAQVEIFLPELPDNMSGPIALETGYDLTHPKIPSGSDTDYKALLGDWHAEFVGDQSRVVIVISEDEQPGDRQTGKSVKLTFKTHAGLKQRSGIASFDTDQRRWVIALDGPNDSPKLWASLSRLNQKRARALSNAPIVQRKWVLLNRIK